MAPPSRRLRGGMRGSIEVPIPPCPKYTPGSGPPPPAISLLPENGPSAHILSKSVYPPRGTRLTLQERRRLHYMIGWADLPATQVSVPCTDVLDWVSPREVERWEYNDLLRREEEERRKSLKGAKNGTGKRRKRGGTRPKPRQQAVEPSPPVLKPEDEALISQKKAAGPSLSTPQKRKFEELLQEDTEADEVEDNVEDNDPDAVAIFRQLNGSDVGDQPLADDYGMSEAYDSAGQLGMQVYSSAADDEESPAPKAARAEEPSPTRLGPFRPNPVPPSDTKLWAKPLTTPTENQMETGSAKKKPLLNAFDLLRDGSRKNGLSKSKSKTSTPKAARPPQSNGESHEEHPRVGFTPLPTLKSNSGKLFASVGPIAPSPSASTPVGKARDTPASTPVSQTNLPKSTQKEPKRRKTAKDDATLNQDEDSFEVKALLDDKNDYDENGNLVRYFQVLWVGNWPEWQNPSWEPEDNISGDLIAEYIKKKESKMKNGYLTGPSPKKQRTSPWMPQKRYSNVAEAFAGDIDAAQTGNAKDQAIEDDEVEDEVLLVTEDKGQ